MTMFPALCSENGISRREESVAPPQGGSFRFPRCVIIFLFLASNMLMSLGATKIQKRGNLWIMENAHIILYVEPCRGTLQVRDKRNNALWKQPIKIVTTAKPVFRDIEELPTGIAFKTSLLSREGKEILVKVEASISPNAPQLSLVVDREDRKEKIGGCYFFEPFFLPMKEPVVAFADYCNGHIYPADSEDFPFPAWGADRLDMPWLGVCDLAKGNGYALIIDTNDDAVVYFERYSCAGKKIILPRIYWEPSKGCFAYPRKIIYHFVEEGGYVALAKAYRNYAKEKGLLVTLREKMKSNPNLRLLMGAPDVWVEEALWKEDASFYPDFVLQAKALGVERMLIQGRSEPRNIAKANSLGYITSEYDVYTDILPLEEGQEMDPLHGRIPEDAVLLENGERLKGIFTWDTKLQFMKRCPALWIEVAKVTIPKILEKYPFRGRFLDVVTAEGLYECYDDKHPLTKGDKRESGVELLRYVRSLGLVVGSEHGIWWAVPVIDYMEGMMSGNPAHFSWPAGQLIRPKSKDEEFADPFGNKLPKWEVYDKWGIGHRWRVPLWELVFHDCVVSTWYWGDSSDFLLESAPEVTLKKEAFNILYGTIPLLWSRTWSSNRNLFLQTYRNTCKLHEVLGDKEMLSHEFLTPDRDVQKTVFSDGTFCIVNFGEKPYSMEFEGRKYLLPQNGFFVKGPRIEQRKILEGKRVVTTIKTKDYFFSDAQGVEVEMRIKGTKKALLRIGGGKTVKVNPRLLIPDWDIKTARLFLLDPQGKPLREMELHKEMDSLILGPFPDFTNLEVRFGS